MANDIRIKDRMSEDLKDKGLISLIRLRAMSISDLKRKGSEILGNEAHEKRTKTTA